jgi:hypothetical protein
MNDHAGEKQDRELVPERWLDALTIAENHREDECEHRQHLQRIDQPSHQSELSATIAARQDPGDH